MNPVRTVIKLSDKSNSQILVGIDPGKDKTGLAIVEKSGSLIEKKIIKSDNLKSYLEGFIHKYKIKKIIMGDGTHSKNLIPLIRDLNLESLLFLIDETGTTRDAERLYFKENPPGGIKKLLSLFLSWKPSRPVDDYAAFLLVRKYLKDNG